MRYLLYGKPAKENFKKYSKSAKKTYFDVRVYFKRFDFYKRKSRFNVPILYYFNKADIFLAGSSLIVFSKNNPLGSKLRHYNFAINLDNKNRLTGDNLYSFDSVSVKLNNGDLEVEFIDPHFTNSIVLVIKKIGADILESIGANENNLVA
ncbi:MAG: hypothetical protein ACM3Q2_08810 [Syntrophothermus sp.]